MMNAIVDRARMVVVDDAPPASSVLRTALVNHGYTVQSARDSESALALIAHWRPSLVIIDLTPRIDGLGLCRNIRSMSDVPCIALSLQIDEQSKVDVLDSGADDCVIKPLGLAELLARVRAKLRRRQSECELIPAEAGDFRFDRDARCVRFAGHAVHLTPKEFDLLGYLARYPNRVLAHRTLLNAVWGENAQERSEYLRVFIGQLRKKLEPDPSSPTYLVTEPWVGYRFNPSGKTERFSAPVAASSEFSRRR
jgi:two-component system KDP operon response regulator KdpE